MFFMLYSLAPVAMSTAPVVSSSTISPLKVSILKYLIKDVLNVFAASISKGTMAP